MALFRRNKVQQNTIPELQEYYNAERRERSGLSWLLALVSVACAGLLLIGLVFGGKWLYNKLANNMDKDKTPTAQTENNSDNQPATPAETDTSTPSEASDGTAAPAPATASTPASNAPATTPSATTPSTTTAPAASTPTSTTPSATSSTSGTVASASSPLPNTGPADTLVVVIVTVVGATAVRYTIFKRKNF